MALSDKERAEQAAAGMDMLDAFGGVLDALEGLVSQSKARGWSDAQARAIVVAFNCTLPGSATPQAPSPDDS